MIEWLEPWKPGIYADPLELFSFLSKIPEQNKQVTNIGLQKICIAWKKTSLFTHFQMVCFIVLIIFVQLSGNTFFQVNSLLALVLMAVILSAQILYFYFFAFPGCLTWQRSEF